ncbi:MAG: c-type cytochrome biogenesis protein CcsB [bacterium]|nr:c-type cytochrome biogenesis protein CcsB [bacterium]
MPATRLFFTIAEVAYLFTALTFAVSYASRKRGFHFAAMALLILGALFQTLFIAWRWAQAERPPLSNTFETLVFFSLAIAVTCIVLELRYSVKGLGAGASLLALLVVAYANLFDWQIEPLMPALQNNLWLTLHVIFCFVGYAGFGVSYIVALIFLLKHPGGLRSVAAFIASLSAVGIPAGLVYGLSRKSDAIAKLTGWPLAGAIGGTVVVAGLIAVGLVALLNARKVSPEGSGPLLSNLISKTIAFGFPFLTLGIITGSVWANVAWGRYWGWDAKETWSLITWVVYAFFLHVRFAGGWLGIKPKSLPEFQAILSVIGFLFVLFTYFGVNYLLSGLHTYA